ncbi:hypothetical protein DPEC_G00183640 [Dallia pectoralis]|uniref:Uncharacterized protein n=1 Tax=Dallia pectoralis TaxID=75939 RepID=A0ACC2GB44_DALPE|nr:hypothetical protein DPEC_G00183640 [Dallia pectoralis]
MVNYKVQLFTGDIKAAGTVNRIYMKLSGAEGDSERIYIDQTAYRGSVIEYDVPCPSTLGQLEFVTLETYAPFAFFNDDWFCSKVLVTTPEGSTCLFPCYTWLTGNVPQVFREATGTLVFNEGPRTLTDRKEKLKNRQQEYQWSSYGPGLPDTIKADNAWDLPAEVRFSFTKNIEFQYTAIVQLVELIVEKLCSNKEWQHLKDIDHFFNWNKTKVYEYVQKNWTKDEFFGYQFLNGTNPMMIKRCTELPENFPVTEDMVKASLSEKSLQEEMQDGNIFLVDYNRLDGVTANVINDKQHYLTAPLCLFYKNSQKKLMPIAIQLKQKPSKDNPIFLPTDSEYDWLLAKIFVKNSDFAEHEVNSHLLRTHLLAEVFAVSTLRNLPMVHPVYKNASIGGPGMMEFLKKAMSELTYSSLCIPEDITARGLEDVPNFYYRDDGLKLWHIIHKFVESVIDHYYTSDSHVQEDSELQNWISEIFVKGFLSNVNTGIPNIFSSKTELVKFLTMTIFTASVQHAAVNNGQVIK